MRKAIGKKIDGTKAMKVVNTTIAPGKLVITSSCKGDE
jgi:hypothetical protein